MAYLICKLGAGNCVDMEIPPRPFTIGRSSEADLQIVDERISRIHCGVRAEGDAYIIKDLGSTNGTWVNDRRIQEVRLRFGDTIRVGHTVIAFESQPRQQATSKLPEVMEVELPSAPFSENLQRLADEAIQANRPPSPPPAA